MKTEPFGNKKANKILLSYLSSLSHFEGLFTGDDETKKHKRHQNSSTVLAFQKKVLGPTGPQVFIFGHQNKYSGRQKLYLRVILMEHNKLNIFYVALTEKECFRLPFELSFEQVSLEAQLPAGVRENEPTLKHKSPQTGTQA